MNPPKLIKIMSNIYYVSSISGLVCAFLLLISVFTPYFLSSRGFAVDLIQLLLYIFIAVGLATSTLLGVTGVWGLAFLLTLMNTKYFMMLAVIILALFAPLNFLMAYGMENRMKFARTLAIITYTLGLIGSASLLLVPKEHLLFIPSIYYGIISAACCLVFLFYLVLNKEVREYFFVDVK